MFKLFNICNKNIKITLRTWTYILFLVVGPAVLMFSTGFTVGQAKIQYLMIGVVAEQNPMIDDFLGKMEGETNIIRYDDLFGCIEDAKTGRVSICTKFTDISGAQNNTNLLITVYYDNSKVSLSTIVMGYLQAKISEAEKQITTQTMSKMIGEATQFDVMVVNAQQFINKSKTELDAVKGDLIETKSSLSQIKDDFDERYKAIKEMQPGVNKDSSDAIESIEKFNQQLDAFEKDSNDALNEIEDIKSILPAEQLVTINNKLDNITSLITKANAGISGYKSSLAETSDKIQTAVGEFNSMVELMEDMGEFLNLMLTEIDSNIEKVEDNRERLNAVYGELDQTRGKLGEITDLPAASFTNPLISLFKPFYPERSMVYLFFPTLLALTISFLGIFFANIFTINEIQSKGYIRNFLTPVNSLFFSLGSFLVILLLVLFQVTVLLFIARYNFGIDIFSNFPSLFISIVLISAIFIEVGMILGYAFKSIHLSILTSTFLVLALFLFSDILTPSEAMHPVTSFIISMNPLVFGANLFRKVLFLDLPVTGDILNIAKIGIFLVVFTALLMLISSSKKRRF